MTALGSPARPTLSVGIPTFGALPPDGGWRSLLDLGRILEDAGVDRVIVADHVVNGPNVADYPWGTFPTGPDAHWLEPLTVLTGIASVTEHLRLGTGILIAPLRPAPLLAKQVATLDQLSGGRVDLGVGTGWQQAEFDAFGLDFAARGHLLNDTMGACRALWERQPATFTSGSVSFIDTYCSPPPAQPRLPVWFSGTLHGRNVSRIVELGDGWIPIMGSTAEDIQTGVTRLRTAMVAAGRPPESLLVRHSLPTVRGADGQVDLGATMAAVPAMVDAGATDIHASIQAYDRNLSDPAGACHALVAAFKAALG